jgi:hypothetical protein
VLLVVLLLVASQVATWAVGLVGGGRSGGATAAGEPLLPAGPAASTPAPPAGPPATDSTDGAVADTVAERPAPSATTPARVAIYGDSHAGGFGPFLQRLLDESGIVESSVTYKVSSGLVRDDFYDWPAELPAIVEADDPDIAVVAWGGNDAQGITVDGQVHPLTSDAWAQIYAERVTQMLDILTGSGARVVWVGLANAPDPEFSARLEVVRDVTRAAIDAYPVPVAYVDTWARFSGLSGGYAEYVIDPRDGVGKDVRAGDGNHLNPTGAEILSLDIWEAVKVELRALGAEI